MHNDTKKIWKKMVFLGLAFGPFVSAYAGFILPVSGNSRPQVPNGVGGTVDFTVMDQSDAVLGDTWGTGANNFDRTFVAGQDLNGNLSPGLDRQARYLYLYQVVNDGANGVAISRDSVNILVPLDQITSWGYFKDMSLADDKTGSGTPVPVSYTNTFGTPAPQQNDSPATMNVINPYIVSIAGGTDPGVNPDSVVLLNQTFYAAWNTALPTKRRATLFGFTTNDGPTIDNNNIHPNPHTLQ